jgi:hypothetical protein
LNLEKRKEPLFKHLDNVIKVSSKKFESDTRENNERIRWGNLIIKAVHEYGFLLKAEDTDVRLAQLEEKLKNGVVIPNGNQ